MSRLLLVRHAQASFLSQNYDRLSAHGEIQARLLGAYWARQNMRFSRVACGPAVRHIRTAALAAEAYRRDGVTLPAPTVLPEFDEFQGDAVLAQCLPQLCAEDPRFRKMQETLQSSATDREKHANFQRLFQAVISLWVDEKIAPPGVESWREFSARVQCGLASFLAALGKGEVAVIFSSGGPIALAVQRALHLSVHDTLQLAWMARNCSITEFLCAGERFTLSTFNTFPHLDDEALLTYR